MSWYQPHLCQSLELIRHSLIGQSAAVIDIGGGTSTLVDDLLDDGVQDLTILDISAAALQIVRDRLGPRASSVKWLEADILEVKLPPDYFDVWHDRAVFHFLTMEQDQRHYVDCAKSAIKLGGNLVVATFAMDGPQQCSNLTTARYSPDLLQAAFSDGFELVESASEIHETPWHGEQSFVYCRFRRTGSA